MSKKQEIAKVLKLLGINYDKEIDRELFDFWECMLSKYSISDIKRSAYKHMERSKFFPKFSELKEIIEENKLKIDFDSQYNKDGSVNPYYGVIDVRFDENKQLINLKALDYKNDNE